MAYGMPDDVPAALDEAESRMYQVAERRVPGQVGAPGGQVDPGQTGSLHQFHRTIVGLIAAGRRNRRSIDDELVVATDTRGEAAFEDAPAALDHGHSMPGFPSRFC